MDNRPEAIRADLEASLLRLGVDHVDLLQIHDLDRSTPIEESWGELQRLREEGKIRWAGLSNHPAELVERAHAVAPVTSCQESLSLLEGPKHPDVLEVVRRHGIGLLCWAPLASGFLVDGFSTDELEPDDFRRSSPLAERGEEIDAARARRRRTRPDAPPPRRRLGARAAGRDRRDRRRPQRARRVGAAGARGRLGSGPCPTS